MAGEADKKSPEEVSQTIPPDSDAEQPSTSEGKNESAEVAGDTEVVEKEVEAAEIEKSQEIEPSEKVDAEPSESMLDEDPEEGNPKDHEQA